MRSPSRTVEVERRVFLRPESRRSRESSGVFETITNGVRLAAAGRGGGRGVRGPRAGPSGRVTGWDGVLSG